MKGKRILILRPAGKAETMVRALERKGAIPVVVPAVAIIPIEDPSHIDQALEKLGAYDWVIITSAAGAEVFSSRVGIKGVEIPKERTRFASVGPETAKALKEFGIKEVWIPEKFATDALGNTLPDPGRTLLLRADIADSRLETILTKRGFDVERVDAYQSVPIHEEPIREAIESRVDAVALTSASIARAFARAVDLANLVGGPAICCIGPPTAEACRESGLEVAVVAQEHTTAGLVKAMENYFAERKPV